MELETEIAEPRRRPAVALLPILLTIVLTGAAVSAFFLWPHKPAAPPAPVAAPAPVVAAPVLTPPPAAVPLAASAPAASEPTPTPAPVAEGASANNLTDQEIFRRASPSVVMLQSFDEAGNGIKLGSGFIAGDNGEIVTNYHVIRGAAFIKAVFQDGSTAEVLGVLGSNAAQDLAVVRVPPHGEKPLEMADSDQIQVGEHVVAIGSPLGMQNTLSDGLVSALRSGYIQTSAPISAGSSGSPLLNQHGQVIGVAVSQLAGAQNLNFVIPINLAQPYLAVKRLTPLKDLVRRNTVRQPVVHSTVTVPPRQARRWKIQVDANNQDNAVLEGTFLSRGMMGGKIHVLVEDQTAKKALFDSKPTVKGKIHLKLQGGTYVLVISNEDSHVFSRTVKADVFVQSVQ